MKRANVIWKLSVALMVVLAAPLGLARADDEAGTVKKMYEFAKPSLVAVKYTWENELGSQELSAAGVIVREDGLVAFSIEIMPPALVPNDQIKRFKIIVPSETQDETEIDGTFQGRDERSDLAFVKPENPVKWQAIKFVGETPVVGDRLYSVGMLPKSAGYKSWVTTARMATVLRGPVPQILVSGELAGTGAVVLDGEGQAIGLVHPRALADALLDNPENPEDMPMVNNPPRMYIPASDFLPSIKDPPTPDHPLVIPWIGCQMIGLEKEEAEYFGLKNVPSVSIADVIPDSPAAKAGLTKLDIITQIDGKPIERGDLPVELPEIVTRKIQRMNVGDKVTFTVTRGKGDAPRQLVLTLEARPKEPQEVRRFYARELGFVVREVTFGDTYYRHIPADTEGVVVALLRPQAAAQAAQLGMNDLITQMNGKPVSGLDEFKKDYLDFRKDHADEPVVLEVTRLDGKQQTVNIQPPQEGANPGVGG